MAERAVFLEEVAEAVGIFCIQVVEKFCVFDGYFVEVDDIVQQVRVFDDAEFSASLEAFVPTDPRVEGNTAKKDRLIAKEAVRT